MNAIHVMPDTRHDAREHRTASDCWCDPSPRRLCQQCDGDGCWLCGEGDVPCASREAEMFVHNCSIHEVC